MSSRVTNRWQCRVVQEGPTEEHHLPIVARVEVVVVVVEGAVEEVGVKDKVVQEIKVVMVVVKAIRVVEEVKEKVKAGTGTVHGKRRTNLAPEHKVTIKRWLEEVVHLVNDKSDFYLYEQRLHFIHYPTCRILEWTNIWNWS